VRTIVPLLQFVNPAHHSCESSGSGATADLDDEDVEEVMLYALFRKAQQGKRKGDMVTEAAEPILSG
jgi:hypothetical protein